MKKIAPIAAFIMTIIFGMSTTGLSIRIYLFISGEFSSQHFSVERTLLFDVLFYSIPFVLSFLDGMLIKTFLWANQTRKAKTMIWLSILSFFTGVISYLAHETIDAGYFCTTIIMNGLLDASIWGIVIFAGFVIAIELFFRKEDDDLPHESDIYH